MGDDFSNPGQWQDGIERRVSDLESKVDEQAGLRADMDEELGTISAAVKAHEKSLNALRETQVEQGKTLTTIKDDVAILKSDMGMVKIGVHSIHDLLNANLAKQSLASRLRSRFTRNRDAA